MPTSTACWSPRWPGRPSTPAGTSTNGVDIVVAQGYEAGGHTGEIASMVLVPEIVDAVGAQVPVLGRGRDRLRPPDRRGARARRRRRVDGLGLADHRGVRELTSAPARHARRCCAATSSDTVRSRIYSGKPARLLKNRWTEAWAEPGAPEPLPMPLQNLLVSEAHQRLMRSGQPDVVPMPVGQIVGRMNEVRPVAEVIAAPAERDRAGPEPARWPALTAAGSCAAIPPREGRR